MKITKIFPVIACIGAGITSVTAQAADEAVNPVWAGQAELGFIDTSGNTDTRSLNGKFNLTHDQQPMKTRLKLEALTSEENGEKSKERYFAELKGDYTLSDRSYVASVLSYDDDRFTGFEYQGVLSVGYGYHAWRAKQGHFDIEVGPGYRRTSLYIRNDEGDKLEEELIGRLSLDFAADISDNATFLETFTVEAGEFSTVYRSIMGLQSTLVSTLAMKINYEVKYIDNVPEGTEKMDTIVGATLVYGF
jgi:putative salt-induced outer membrane protein YdiY